MSELLKKIKALYEKVRKVQISYDKPGVRPSRDWGIVLGVSQVLIIILALLALYFYMKVNDGSFFVAQQDKTENYLKINMTLLNKTVKDINTRQNDLSKIKQGKTIPRDPTF